VSRYIGIILFVQGSLNKIEKYVKFDPTGSGFDSRGMLSNPGDLMYYGVDASVKYSFMNLINSKVIDPSTCWWRLYFFGDSSYGTLNRVLD
jgi:hypothetical protein